jgi:hypothetical protein
MTCDVSIWEAEGGGGRGMGEGMGEGMEGGGVLE